MRLLHGRPLAERLNARSRERSDTLRARDIHPALAAISVGIDPAVGGAVVVHEAEEVRAQVVHLQDVVGEPAVVRLLRRDPRDHRG